MSMEEAKNKVVRLRKTPFLIGVAGGTASGKSTVCEKIMDCLRQNNLENVEHQVVHLSQDSFYRELIGDERAEAANGFFNFDHPTALDNALMEKCLRDIMEGRITQIPVYDFKSNSRVPNKFTTIDPISVDVVLFEGILTFYNEKVRDMFNMKLFVDTDADSRLSKRVLKDVDELGRNLDQPAFEEFCLPTKKFADVIIPRGPENTIAIDLISQHITDRLSSPRDVATSICTNPPSDYRKRHFSDTSNMYESNRGRVEIRPVLTRPH